MRSLIKPLTRGALIAASGGAAVAFDCLECTNGVYVFAHPDAQYRPLCTRCGCPAPDYVWRVMRASLLAKSKRAA